MGVESYLKEHVDDHVAIKPWHDEKIFPIFLRDHYNFYEMRILGSTCILMETRDEMPGIGPLKKHMKQIQTITNCQIVLFYKVISNYRRKSLIENRIPFVIQDGQMYLPFLGLDLKRAFQYEKKDVKQFTCSAQLTFLFFLYHKNEAVNMTEFAKKMGFTNMTASRALNELYHANLLTYEIGRKTGRSKEYERIPDPDYFFNGRIYIKSPVKKTVYAKTKPLGALTAGLDALAELSMINPPDHPVMALGQDQYKNQKIEIIKNKDLIKDEPLVEVQIWDHDPKQFANGDHVDLLSLYASLKEENDERVEGALEEVLRGESWYT